MNSPILWQKYTREQAQNAFLPGTPFKRGSWGMTGIVRIQQQSSTAFVLFVNLAQHYTDVFEESIDNDGVLTWQSQPSQTLDSKVVQELIHHQETQTTVHLFLQTTKINTKGIYTYMGELRYLAHDTTREKPVHFKWALQVLPPDAVLQSIPLELKSGKENKEELFANIPIGKLQLTSKPFPKQSSTCNPLDLEKFKGFHRDYEQFESRNRQLGLAGEKLVIENEKLRLIAAGKPELAEKVEHISLARGDGLGYDILSYTPSGDCIFIEVKTTTGSIDSVFYISPNELNFSAKNAERYKLVRVYDFDINTGTGKAYELNGDLNQLLQLKPIQFQATVK